MDCHIFAKKKLFLPTSSFLNIQSVQRFNSWWTVNLFVYILYYYLLSTNFAFANNKKSEDGLTSVFCSNVKAW